MTLPNFIIIGAVKSGTSSIFRYMTQHPEIFTSTPKEPSFFLFDSSIPQFCGPGDHIFYQKSIVTLKEYEDLFKDSANQKCRGEATASYLHDHGSAKRIFKCIPETKIVVVLRNPIERAYSHYWMYRSTGREKETFETALALEEKRQSMNWAPGWRYRSIGLYHSHLERYLDLFPKNHCHITLYDDLENDPKMFMRKLFRFLEVDDSFVPNMSIRYNVAGVSKSQFVNFILTSRHPARQMLRDIIPVKLRYNLTTRLRQKYLSKPEMSGGCREQLRSTYHDDVCRLEKLLNRSLANWLQ